MGEEKENSDADYTYGDSETSQEEEELRILHSSMDSQQFHFQKGSMDKTEIKNLLASSKHLQNAMNAQVVDDKKYSIKNQKENSLKIKTKLQKKLFIDKNIKLGYEKK